MATATARPKPSSERALTSEASALSAAHAQELEDLLRQLISHHENVVELAREHRDAIARADVQAMAACVARQQTAAKRYVELEGKRAHLVAAASAGIPVTRGVRPGAMRPTVTLSAIAARTPEPVRSRLMALAAHLRGLIVRAGEQHRVLRSASESLLGHMAGLMTQVRRALNPGGVYSRPAVRPPTAPAR